MRSSLIPLLALVALGVSHVVAVTTESQVAAQLSWILLGVVALTTAAVLASSGYRRLRQSTNS